MIKDPIAALAPLREAIANHRLSADKRFGQNFLLDLNLTGRIARAAGDLRHGTTFEIGPGPGGLTRALFLAGARHVVAIERDSRCFAALSELHAAAQGRLTLVQADALALDISQFGPPPRHIVANLPYNIATALLVGWLKQIDAFDSLTLMFQKEVADRLVAKVATGNYGRLSVLSQYQAFPQALFNVPPRAFTPSPKVTSTVVRLTPRLHPTPRCPIDDLESVTAAAFGQRRKMLRSSLKSLQLDAMALLTLANLAPEARAETVTVEEFAHLALCYRRMMQEKNAF